MIITKLLGLTGAITKDKKAKIIILLIEIAFLAYAISQHENNEKDNDLPAKRLN
ncbi:hypothetical protein [Subsaximicrobium wynnwilliamsii]|uniref:hypothetical protein n=1 Tax=Subsaximicrobium wynnwilliamsii TaxID=291179 RepID=UPI001676E696|nr:hypothetical protein [Subsaximicrobium wynnwilliamsii]